MGAKFHWLANTAVAVFFVFGLILGGRHPWILYLWLAAFAMFVAVLLFSYFVQSSWQRKSSRTEHSGSTERS